MNPPKPSSPTLKSFLSLISLLWALLSSTTAIANEQTITIKGHAFTVETAVTPSERKQGLMGRAELKKDHGMLFIYTQPKLISFWMKETIIPLDMLFFDQNGKLIEIIHNAQPCKAFPCETYGGKAPTQFVLEIAGGTAKALGITEGDTFEITQP